MASECCKGRHESFLHLLKVWIGEGRLVDLGRPHCWDEEIQSWLGIRERCRLSVVGGGIWAIHKTQIGGPHQHEISGETKRDGSTPAHQHLMSDPWEWEGGGQGWWRKILAGLSIYSKEIVYSQKTTEFILQWKFPFSNISRRGFDNFVKFNYRKIKLFYFICPSL